MFSFNFYNKMRSLKLFTGNEKFKKCLINKFTSLLRVMTLTFSGSE